MSRKVTCKNPFEFSWKYKEFEIRSSKGINDSPPYIELIKWEEYKGKPCCFTLAYYKWDDEGGEWSFVGTRPFEEIKNIDIETIWKQMWTATELFLDWFQREVD